MNLKRYFFLLIACLGTSVFSQQISLSEKATVSVITCGSGQDLYASFGHSAFRVQDSAQGIDWVYNYGTFDFDTPNFYMKFARGKLLYSLSKQRFENFLYSYQLDNRWVKEQILNLSADEKTVLFEFLEQNHLPENRHYKYDFLFENCSTKMPDILKAVLGDNLVFSTPSDYSPATFRELIQENLNTNTWSSFGIDLALGSVIDKKATPRQMMFLPNYVFRQFKYTELNGESLVTRERTILDYENFNSGNYFTTSPLFWFLLLLLFTITITIIDLKNGSRSLILDFFLFLITGLAGILLFFLWFLTDHSATALNFNILWAFPLNLVAAYFLVYRNKLPTWLPKYILFLVGLLIVVIFLWIFQVQVFSPILAVILLVYAIRYSFLIFHFNKNETPIR